MAFQPYALVFSGIEVDLDAKELRFTLGPQDNPDPSTYVTASIKLNSLPKAENPNDDDADSNDGDDNGGEDVDPDPE